MLSGEAEAKVYSVGCVMSERTAFLWFVKMADALPATRSHSRMVLSIDPLITCGSSDWVASPTTVCWWPHSVCTFALVRTSHMRTTESRPPVARTSSVGCSESEYTPERWPW